MHLSATPTALDTILPFRDLHRQEMNCQIILDSWHQRGWTDSYLLQLNNQTVGYGSVGSVRAEANDIIIEFYVLPQHRGYALPLFHKLIEVSQAKSIEVQTNDHLLTLMLYDTASHIEREAVLFNDAFATCLTVPGVTFRQTADSDKGKIFPHLVEPVGDWIVESGNEIVATGGILFHYNIPYGDIYMEVAAAYRRRGIGSLLIQELKRVCYAMGRIPAARCSPTNFASRATLQKAGMLPCARVLTGQLPTNSSN